jgi:phosphopantetheinyl transferase (holo-ACP synthase)
MPLLDYYKLDIVPDTWLGIWQNNEPVTFFEEKINLYPAELHEIAGLKYRKRLEWFSSRYILHLLSEREVRGACLKDEYGKPYLENSEYHISMSHSHELTAVIASKAVVGVDIQYKVEKITRIVGRVLSDSELSDLGRIYSLEAIHVYWGAKEAMYKIYGRKEVDFRKELMVNPFEIRNGRVRTTGIIIKNGVEIECKICAEVLTDYVLVYAWDSL